MLDHWPKRDRIALARTGGAIAPLKRTSMPFYGSLIAAEQQEGSANPRGTMPIIRRKWVNAEGSLEQRDCFFTLTEGQLEETKLPKGVGSVRIQPDQALKYSDCLRPMPLRSQKRPLDEMTRSLSGSISAAAETRLAARAISSSSPRVG